MVGLNLWGIPLQNLQKIIEHSSDIRLIRLIAMFKERWGFSKEYYAEHIDNPIKYQDISVQEITACLVYGDMEIELITRKRHRLHLENPVYINNTAIALKRGVSWRELNDIFATRKVMGKLNKWHSGDKRLVVLWANTNTSDRLLLTQANDLYRQSEVILCEELGHDIKYGAIDDAVKRDWIREEKIKRENAEWTSAVITTHLITGSQVWSKHHMDNMFNIDEYGFPAGYIELKDIYQISLYKEKELVFTGTPSEVEQQIAYLNSPEDKASHFRY